MAAYFGGVQDSIIQASGQWSTLAFLTYIRHQEIVWPMHPTPWLVFN